MNMVATTISATVISVQWNAPPLSDRNGKMVAYHILIKNRDTGIIRSANVSADTYYFIVEGIIRKCSIVVDATFHPLFLFRFNQFYCV